MTEPLPRCEAPQDGPDAEDLDARSRDPRNPWRTLACRVVYANSWITVREDSVIRPDGQPGIYGVVQIRPSVGIIAIDDRPRDGDAPQGNARENGGAVTEPRIALVSQWRYTLGKTSLEIPTGGSETGEGLLDAAKRELAEAIDKVLAGEITESVSVAGILKAEVLQACRLRARASG